MKATEQYFPAVLFIMLYKVVLTFQSVDEILKGDDSNESYLAAVSSYSTLGEKNVYPPNLNSKKYKGISEEKLYLDIYFIYITSSKACRV